MTLLDKTKKEVTEKRSLGFDELDHQRSQEQHPDLVAPVVEGHTPDETLEGSDSSGGES